MLIADSRAKPKSWRLWARTCAGLGAVAVVIGCALPQAAAPATSLPATVAAAAQAVGAPTAADAQLVSGSIDTISGRALSVSTNRGTVEVQVAENGRIESEGKGTLADLVPGASVRITLSTRRIDGQGAVDSHLPGVAGHPSPGPVPDDRRESRQSDDQLRHQQL